MVQEAKELVRPSSLKRCAMGISSLSNRSLTLSIGFLVWIRSFSRGTPVMFGSMIMGIILMSLFGVAVGLLTW